MIGAIFLIVWSSTSLKLHPFLALLITSLLFGISAGIPPADLIKSIQEGFGATLGSIGIVIILGVIIGTFLERSGGAFAIAALVLKLVGKKNVHWAMSLMGFVVAIPVFADSGFIILASLNRSLSKEAKLSLAGTTIALALGLIMTHVLVPPTPGPMAAAGILGADLGLVIFWGIIVGFLSLVPGVFFAKYYAARTITSFESKSLENNSQNEYLKPPPTFWSFLPIVLPIVLIVLRSFHNYSPLFENKILGQLIDFIGTPAIALLIGLGFALLLPKKLEKQMLSAEGWVGKALPDAAIILLITGAGGAFGKVLQQAGLDKVIGDTLGQVNLGIWLPFLIAAALKTAQGSSTVAMITTASILQPLLPQLGLESEMDRVLLVLAIGAGSAVVSHANDSFFWIVTQMSGMDVRTGYRLHSLGTAVIGFAAGLVLNILWWILNL